MKSIFARCAIAGFLAASDPALAGEQQTLKTASMSAVIMTGTETANYRRYYMEEKVMSDRSTERGLVFVDKIVGVTCEWTENGRREADEKAVFHTVGVTVKKTGCVDSVETPATWKAAKQVVALNEPLDIKLYGLNEYSEEDARRYELAMTGAVGLVAQEKTNRQILREDIIADNPPGMWIKHSWNMAANEVCLETLIIPEAEDDDARPESILDWGCFPVKNQKYFDAVIRAGGINPT